MIHLFITIILPSQLFARTYGGTNIDVAWSITRASDEGYAMVGSTWSFSTGQSDFVVSRFNADGSLAWARTFGGTAWEEGRSIVQTTDGGYAVAGTTRSYGVGLYDFLVLKLNPDGSLAWARTFGGTSYEYASSIVQTTDGGYAMAGSTRSFGAGGYDFFVLRLNPDGSLAWARTFGGTGTDQAFSIIQTTDGGYAVAGYAGSFGAGDYDFFVVKLNPDGSLDWVRTFGGANTDVAPSIIQTTDGGYAIAGYTRSFGSGGDDLLVLKLNPDGSLAWARTFGGAGTDYAYSITQANDGGYAVAGETGSFGSGGDDLLVLKLNPDGSLAWARTFGGTGTDEAYSITQANDGGYAMAVWTNSFGAGDYDFLILKIGADGRYPSCVLDCTPTMMAVNPSTSTPSVGVDCSPSTSTPNPATTIPSPTTTNPCMPVYEDVGEIIPGSHTRITCSPISGGLVFLSYGDLPIRIYIADGKLAYAGEIQKGQNLISLGQGVYLWQAGPYKGKAVVR